MKWARIISFGILLGMILRFPIEDTFGEEPMLEMSYRVEGSYSPYRFIEVRVKGDGQAVIRYQKYGEISLKPGVSVEPAVHEKLLRLEPMRVSELRDAYLAADFWNREVVDLNQVKITVTDVGTTTLSLKMDDKERTLSYGYAEGAPFKGLLTIYYRILSEGLPELASGER